MSQKIEYKSYSLTTGETREVSTTNGNEVKSLRTIPTATVWLEGVEIPGIACGNDLFRVLFEAFCQASKTELELKDYRVRANLSGGSHIGSATVRVSLDSNETEGAARDADVIKAFLLALIDAVNQIPQGGRQ